MAGSKMIRELSHEERLRELGMFNLKQAFQCIKRILSMDTNLLRAGVKRMGMGSS